MANLVEHGRFHCLSPIFACLGAVLNLLYCCFGFVLPNCCCAWRWLCCQARYACSLCPCCCRYWSFDDIEPKIQTGDILLFAGAFNVRVGAQSHWSHVGMALRDDEGLHGPKGLLYIFEANFNDGIGWDHCDIRLLREKCATYKNGSTDCAWRSLAMTDEQRQQINSIILKYRGDPYDHDLTHMMYAALDCCPCCEAKKQKRNSKFCSQIVAHVLMKVGVLPKPPKGPPAGEYLPRDFTKVWGGTAESRNLRSKLGRLHIMRRPKNKWTGLSLV